MSGLETVAQAKFGLSSKFGLGPAVACPVRCFLSPRHPTDLPDLPRPHMFKKILIANRGEIACRVIKTARKMGIRTVAVYSDADRGSLHVSMADEAVHIGPPEAANSYLVIDKIIAACKATGAEAVHPGYGFLSEREAFAVALQKAGIVFIGPNPGAIAAMGDKIESKKAAARAKVSTVPGHLGEISDAAHAVQISSEIGYPVMIKASAGGGGKGMRVAFNAKEAEEGFGLARSEAKASFGDDRIIYLGERECSIQRRNQKVIEEAPSPLLDEATRKAMGEQAVALARAVKYDSAGTVEFVAGQDRSFFFLEMNTRLQVEHPVTEMITGIDLVEQMIRVAAGEKLKLTQKDVKLNGWAVESRVYAEDPYRGFLPSIGRLTTYRPPAEGPIGNGTVRNDTGVFEGGEISMYYDPMIAKLVTHAPTRIEAIDLQADALDAFAIAGIQHNIPFLTALMQHPRWREGRLSTGFIAEEYPGGFKARTASGSELDVMAAVGAMIDHQSNARRRKITSQMTGPAVRFAVERVVVIGDNSLAVSVVVPSADTVVVSFDRPKASRLTLVSTWQPGDPVWRGTVDGRPVAVLVRAILNGYQLAHRGIATAIHVYTKREAELAALMPIKVAADMGKFLLCPMPGLIKSVAVEAGQVVKAGDNLAVVEAMKMENVLKAERDGTVKIVRAKAGESLAVDAVILEFA
jgi:propionyl-CoA carboxylase alpha chain